MLVFNSVAALMERGPVSHAAENNNKGQAEQVLVATRRSNGIMAAIMNVQMAWWHRRLADRAQNHRSVCHPLL